MDTILGILRFAWPFVKDGRKKRFSKEHATSLATFIVAISAYFGISELANLDTGELAALFMAAWAFVTGLRRQREAEGGTP
jgi:hypothetical protein